MSQQKNDIEKLRKIVMPLLAWYDSHARVLPWRENPEPYAVWISEIMLQQTRVEAVKPYFDRWMKAFPTISSLAAATEQEVVKLWEGLGYYSRVRNIHKTAKIIKDSYGGQLPPSFHELIKLPGIGEYSAGSIGSIAFQLPVPCVDGNVLRVITRITAEDADIAAAATKKLLTGWVREIVPKDRPGDFNQALMELGATVCYPNGQPDCERCPVSFLCEAYQQNRTAEFPVKKAKPLRKKETKTVLVLTQAGKIAVRKRPDKGLLAGLWEYPNYPGKLDEQDIRMLLEKKGLSPISLVKLKKSKHIFTHIEWHMSGYLAVLPDTGLEQKPLPNDKPGLQDIHESDADYSTESEYIWVESAFLNDRLTIPTAFKVYHQALLDTIQTKSEVKTIET